MNKHLLKSILLLSILLLIIIFTSIYTAEEQKERNKKEIEMVDIGLYQEVIPPISDKKAVEEPYIEEIDAEYLGVYTITAYCSCEKCCGKYALNRPDGIVYGASGKELEADVSVASPLDFGTNIIIEGLGEYVVEDRTADWIVDKYDGEIIDIYFENHEEALKFGKKELKVWRK